MAVDSNRYPTKKMRGCPKRQPLIFFSTSFTVLFGEPLAIAAQVYPWAYASGATFSAGVTSDENFAFIRRNGFSMR